LKEIFVGSSKEGLEQALQVVAALSEVKDVKPLLWTEVFKLGDITFMGIENIASRVAGAVFLATPDDDSVIRERRVRTPRANVLFEYGYLTAMLTRRRVALCLYSSVELPSDFAGLTYVPMGTFEPTKPLDHQASVKLKSWATELPAVQVGFSPTCQMHGYQGYGKPRSCTKCGVVFNSKTQITQLSMERRFCRFHPMEMVVPAAFSAISKSRLVVATLSLRSVTE
jgi:Predicted nucleotide-binding protein containing TIR-like domain